MINQRLSEGYVVIFHDFDPNASDTLTNVNSTNWIDLKDVESGTVILVRTVGTGAVQDAGLYLSAAATGTSASLIGSLHGSSSATGLLNVANGSIAAPDAGRIVMEFNQSDLAAASVTDGRYLGVRASLATGTDEFGCIFILKMKVGKNGQIASGTGI